MVTSFHVTAFAVRKLARVCLQAFGQHRGDSRVGDQRGVALDRGKEIGVVVIAVLVGHEDQIGCREISVLGGVSNRVDIDRVSGGARTTEAGATGWTAMSPASVVKTSEAGPAARAANGSSVTEPAAAAAWRNGRRVECILQAPRWMSMLGDKSG